MNEHLYRLPSGKVVNLDTQRVMSLSRSTGDCWLNYFGGEYNAVRLDSDDAAAVAAHFKSTAPALTASGGSPLAFTAEDLADAAQSLAATALQEVEREIRDRNSGIGQITPQLTDALSVIAAKIAQLLGADIASSEGVEP